jgi:hypothetical protein
MNQKRRLWIIIVTGIVITLIVGLFAFRLSLNCCTISPDQLRLTAILGTNDYSDPPQLLKIATAAYYIALTLSAAPPARTANAAQAGTFTPSPSS